jgi:hypothetical protein
MLLKSKQSRTKIQQSTLETIQSGFFNCTFKKTCVVCRLNKPFPLKTSLNPYVEVEYKVSESRRSSSNIKIYQIFFSKNEKGSLVSSTS